MRSVMTYDYVYTLCVCRSVLLLADTETFASVLFSIISTFRYVEMKILSSLISFKKHPLVHKSITKNSLLGTIMTLHSDPT